MIRRTNCERFRFVTRLLMKSVRSTLSGRAVGLRLLFDFMLHGRCSSTDGAVESGCILGWTTNFVSP
jgi:hypothetical protein